MTISKRFKSNEKGASLVEFCIAAMVFMTAMFAVIEFSRALWVHNALSDAARRGARYAVIHSAGSAAQVRNVVVYGNEAGTGTPMVPNLTPDNVTVDYSEFMVNKGTVTVGITEYQFQFVIPIIGTTITMPNYSTTMTGESVGFVPTDVS